MVKVWYSLYDRMLNRKLLFKAFGKVKSAKGSAGVDGQSINDFARSLTANIDRLCMELREKSYRPLPVLRKEIAKESGGTRLLGIPAVRDRVVQQALLETLQPIFDEHFHPSSYGYRPGRSCHQAISKAAMFIRQYDRKWVVDMDLSKCFDTLDHDLIISSFQSRIKDGSILQLLKKFLRSGVMTGEGWQASETGSPQGGVISPLIANVYLDRFDQFMKERGHRIIRYADDILILSKSKSAAINALKQASDYLEGQLHLTVNQEKTRICHSIKGVEFLGVSIHSTFTRIQRTKVKSFKARVKAMTKRNSPVNLEKVIGDLNPLLRGFANYFRIANCGREFKRLSKWIRRRLRAIQLRLWKKPQRLHRRLRQLGYLREFESIKMNSWANSTSVQCQYALPNSYLHGEMKLFDLNAVVTGTSVSI